MPVRNGASGYVLRVSCWRSFSIYQRLELINKLQWPVAWFSKRFSRCTHAYSSIGMAQSSSMSHCSGFFLHFFFSFTMCRFIRNASGLCVPIIKATKIVLHGVHELNFPFKNSFHNYPGYPIVFPVLHIFFLLFETFLVQAWATQAVFKRRLGRSR